MKLVTFTHGGDTRVGLLDGGEVVDLRAAAPELPTTMRGLLGAGPAALDAARAALGRAGPRLAAADVHLEAPVRRPSKVLGVGLNYRDHIAEMGARVPEVPIIFNKQRTAVVGPGAPIHRPRVSEQLDYEGELGVVIGRRCRHVPRDRAHEVIAAYTIVNDVSVRDWQMRTRTMTMGKSFDTHCPMGPALVTPDELGPGPALDLRTLVNGEERQHSNTRELVFDAPALVEHLSTAFTLEPGDVIATGTPSGVALYRDPQPWLRPGDVVRIEIEGLGALENPVIEEPPETAFIG